MGRRLYSGRGRLSAEIRRLLVEAAGALLVLAGLAMIWIPAAIIAAGCILILVANAYMGADSASADEVDPATADQSGAFGR